jgi:hypothetical protein
MHLAGVEGSVVITLCVLHKTGTFIDKPSNCQLSQERLYSNKLGL